MYSSRYFTTQYNIVSLISRGFLKSDKHFATVIIKLDKFETAGTVHDSFDVSILPTISESNCVRAE